MTVVPAAERPAHLATAADQIEAGLAPRPWEQRFEPLSRAGGLAQANNFSAVAIGRNNVMGRLAKAVKPRCR